MITSFEFNGKFFSIKSPGGDWIGKIVERTSSFYEKEMLIDISSLLEPGSLVVDVGANIGNHTLFFAGALGCNVLAIEPNAEAREFLMANVLANGIADAVSLKSVVVGSGAGKAIVRSKVDGNLGATRYTPTEVGDLELTNLDDLLAGASVLPSLIKIDVEGMELDVLMGAERLIEMASPVLVIECQDADDYEKVSKFLAQFGYGAVACYNATPTYIFLRLKEALTSTEMLAFICLQVMRGQQQVRELGHSLKKAWRHIADLEAR
ncbi:FkbM family methyltransferase [Stenotrophomonas sp.]|uniref:FkbM family methyltransferase n=1 Tax=Stenotrophomonas sp. TaxID=69392 RepID=UPI0028A586C1|nr:FkbM family methyltransferase [Stenotrophomonas sp.]